MGVQIISHRGLCRATPRARRIGENTISAFQAGVEALTKLGFAPAIEFDVRRSGDGRLVVIHDATLRRTTGIRGRVGRLTAEELSSFGVPLLDDLLQRFRGTEFHMEIKDRGVSGLALDSIRRAGAIRRVVVSSFLWRELAPLAGHVRIALTTAFPSRRSVRAAIETGAWALHPEHRRTTARVVEAAHAAGLRVNAWTVNTPRAYARMQRLGVDGVFSDNPYLLVGA
jgi:glycerophosphoryl diester phosphodiesterase